jgi:hypothetical protein
MSISKAAALKLASDSMRDGALAIRGRLERDEDGRLLLGDRDITGWLEKYEGSQLILVLAEIEANAGNEQHVCNVCGRDYVGSECPHCARVRKRLRG